MSPPSPVPRPLINGLYGGRGGPWPGVCRASGVGAGATLRAPPSLSDAHARAPGGHRPPAIANSAGQTDPRRGLIGQSTALIRCSATARVLSPPIPPPPTPLPGTFRGLLWHNVPRERQGVWGGEGRPGGGGGGVRG